jgi:hypothetical protein
MSYRYFDWGGCPARVLFDDKNLFMESLGIDPERGLVDYQYVVSEEKFNALIQERLAALSEPPVRVHGKTDENK